MPDISDIDIDISQNSLIIKNACLVLGRFFRNKVNRYRITYYNNQSFSLKHGYNNILLPTTRLISRIVTPTSNSLQNGVKKSNQGNMSHAEYIRYKIYRQEYPKQQVQYAPIDVPVVTTSSFNSQEAQIIAAQRNKKESLNYITAEFDKLDLLNNKILFDLANFYKNSKEYENAIKYYTLIINTLDENSEIKPDLLYRRGGSYERLKQYKKADKDLLNALKINPEDAYILNYLAYSWLERNYKIDSAIEMLERAYSYRNNDPYIIDSIGWAYYLIEDYVKAEQFLKRAVELMPDDPIVNDHYGDILWKLNRKIQARYFWANVLKMDNAEAEMIEKINIKMTDGLKKL